MSLTSKNIKYPWALKNKGIFFQEVINIWHVILFVKMTEGGEMVSGCCEEGPCFSGRLCRRLTSEGVKGVESRHFSRSYGQSSNLSQ